MGTGLYPAAIVSSRPRQALVPGRVTPGLACTAVRGDCGLGRGYLSRACGWAQGGNQRHRLWVDVCRWPAARGLRPQLHTWAASGQRLLSGGVWAVVSAATAFCSREQTPHPGAHETEARPGLGAGGSRRHLGLAAGPGALRAAAGGLEQRCLQRAEHEGLTRFFHEKAGAPREPGLVCADKLCCGETSPGMRRPGSPIHGCCPVHGSPRCAGSGARCQEPQ